MKGVRIWSFSGPHFPAFGLNTDQKTSNTVYNTVRNTVRNTIFLERKCTYKRNLPFLQVTTGRFIKLSFHSRQTGAKYGGESSHGEFGCNIILVIS